MINCNVCGCGVSAVLVRKGEFEVYQCAECGLAFTYPQPESIAQQYDFDYFDLYRRRREFRLKRGDSRLKRIELMRPPGKLLDIGCSLGYFVEAANARGWAASGIEISPYASGEARELGLDVVTGVIEDAGYEDSSFDCITMWDVLEHVPDPTAHMLGVRRILADDGVVVIGTPNLARHAVQDQAGELAALEAVRASVLFSEVQHRAYSAQDRFRYGLSTGVRGQGVSRQRRCSYKGRVVPAGSTKRRNDSLWS